MTVFAPALIFYFIFICFVTAAGIKASQNRTDAKNQTPAARPLSGSSPKAKAHTHSSPRLYKTVTLKKPGAIKAEEQVSRFMEDRQNDWLARQIREEQRILLRGNGMDLGASHARVCAAGLLKHGHEAECDAGGNDRGEY